MEKFLSTRQAADRLGVSEASVRRWSDSGRLPVRRVGRRGERRFKPEDLNRWAAQPAARPAWSGADRPHVVLGGKTIDLPFHLVALYDSEAGRLRLTVPFLAEGLRAGQPCYLVAHGEELDSYLAALDRLSGVDVDALLASGLLTVTSGPGRSVMDALGYWETVLWAALDGQAPMVRIVGEMASERDTFESERAMLDYETAFNAISGRFPCAVICQYDARKFSGPVLLAALRSHPDVVKVSLSLLLK